MAVIVDPNQPQYDELGRLIRRQWFAPPSWMSEETGEQVPTPAKVPPIVGAQETSLFQPAKLTPTEEEYIRVLRARPQRTPPDKLQRVLAAIAGGAEGYLRASPQAGVEAAQNILEAPRKRQMAEWQEKVAALKPEVELVGELHKRGVDVSKLGLEAGQIEATLDAALARVAATREGQQATERYRDALIQARKDELNRKKLEDEATQKYHKDLLEIQRRQAGASEKRATAAMISAQASKTRAEKPATTSYISPTAQAQAEYLGTMDVMRDPATATLLPPELMDIYVQEVKDPRTEVVAGYRLNPRFDARKMDRNLYDLLRVRIDSAIKKRLNQTRSTTESSAFTLTPEEE